MIGPLGSRNMHYHAVSAFRILSVRAESVGTTGASRFNKTSLLVSIMADHKVTPEPGRRCRRSSSTQEQRYPPPLPLGATAPPTCGRRKSDPGLRVTTQDQEYPLRKLREIRDTSNGS